MKKILIVCPSNKGTIAICTLNLWKALLKCKDLQVKCVLIYKLQEGLRELKKCEYCIDSAPKGGLKTLFGVTNQIKWLRRVKKEFHPDVTISSLFNTSTLSVLSGGTDKKIGIFHSPHKQAKSAGKISYISTLLTYHFLYPLLDKLFCVSREVEQSIVDSFPTISNDKIEVVYNAHNIDKIRNEALEELESDKECDIFNNEVYLYIGRFDRNKAPERALKAFAMASLSRNSKLVYIGGGNQEYEDELRNLAFDLGVGDRVFLLGTKKNPYKYLNRAKALVSSSFSEGLPGVMIEAMILGKPVVSTNSSEGVWEILSCHDRYKKDLRENNVSEFGIITPNSLDEDENIKNLRDAISKINKNEFCKRQSPFISKVSYESIARKYADVIESL